MKLAASLLVLLFMSLPSQASEPLKFGVLNQHPVALTAQIWNPILQYLSDRSGVPLTLAMGKTAQETTQRTVAGEYDFVYTNHLFTPERTRLGFRTLARFNTEGIRGQIVVAANSPIHSLRDLNGRKIAFPSREAFAGYALPMRALQKGKVHAEAVFAGNQEGAMAQLSSGATDAAGVNDAVMKAFSQRENFQYRAIYTSETYQDLAVMAHPRVPRDSVEKVRAAMLGMGSDAEGRRLLDAANEIFKSTSRLEFVPTSDSDYSNYRRFYRKGNQ